MSQPIPSRVANLALAIGVAAAMGIAVALTVTHSSHRPRPPRTDVGMNVPTHGVAPLPASPPAAPAAFAATQLRSATAEPFEPPPPVINETATATALSPPDRQVAALTPPEETAEPAESSPLPAPPELLHREAAPRREPPPHRLQSATREPAASTPPQDDADEPDGVKLAGPAIVTGPLELNIDGKPLELYGVKPPTGVDICSPGGDYAARSCLDVSRQALAARIGLDGDVTCRILAVGGRSALPAVCTDSKGADLATYLVAHGFALADPNEIVDYSGAEARAKGARAGLWSYR